MTFLSLSSSHKKKLKKLATLLLIGMAKHILKSTETRYELSTTLYLQSEINFCFVRMPVNA